MKYMAPAIEEVLEEASGRWRWLQFLQKTAVLASVVTSVVLFLGICMSSDSFTSSTGLIVCFVLLGLASSFTWMFVGLATAVQSVSRSRLAASVERLHEPLQDRLNTLVFLEQTEDRRLEPYADRIQQQTRQVLHRQPACLPFPAIRALRHFGVFLAILLATILFYSHFHPWQHVRAATRLETVEPEQPEPSLEIPPEPAPADEMIEEAPWGEIRISEPGQDLRATTLDIIPLRIEAAANRPLTQVEWFTSVNAQPETTHELPPPDDPRYAVYEPELVLQEFGVQEWDLLSYYARATAEDGQTYDSDLFFAEVLPFRQQLDELPGGPEGPTYRLLEQLTRMIERQKQVIRQTHQQQQSADHTTMNQTQQTQALAQDEADLRQETRHLIASVQTHFQESAIAGLDEPLERAESTLSDAEDTLRDNDLNQASQHERNALEQLVAARKHVYKRVSANPQAFQEPAQKQADDPTRDTPQNDGRPQAQNDAQPPDTLDPLEAAQPEIASARDFVRKLLGEQRNVEQQANPRQQNKFPKLEQQQRQLKRSLDNFIKQNPQSFCRSQKECSNAQSAMQHAAESLSAKAPNAREHARQAADALQKLDQSLETLQERNRLAKAYELKKKLDQQIDQLSQCRRQGASAGQCRRLAQGSRSVAGQLKRIAEQEASSKTFGPQLGKALSDQHMQKLTAQADQLEQAADSAEQKHAAGELHDVLQQIAHAFEASCPGTSVGQEPGDPLRATGREAIARGMRPLESAARRQAANRPLSRQQQSQLAREAIANLQEGVPAVYGHNENARQLLSKLQRDLDEQHLPVNLQMVRELIAQIQQLRREVAVKDDVSADPSKMMYIDPSRLPPAYRQSIQKYFEKLSEQP